MRAGAYRALVIGGTRFVGAAIIDLLLARGANVTIFSRGQTNPEMFADLDIVRGDRTTDIDRIGDRRFDAVFDSCGYVPEQLEGAIKMAAKQDAFYVFVSSASVYANLETAERVDEDHELEAVDPAFELAAVENYGAAKVLCENALFESLGGNLAVLRPGLIVGPRDYTDRFPHWAERLGRPGRVLLPGDGLDPTQVIDARDFAALAVRLAEDRATGVYNASGPRDATFGDFVELVAGAELEPVWAPTSFLAERKIAPWLDMPCWLPRDHESSGILRLDCWRAEAAGLELRSWSETAADTRAWLQAEGRERPFSAGLSQEREAELIAELGG